MITSLYLSGFLSDEYGRKQIMVPALLATFLINTATSLVSDLWIVLILRFFSGFA
jgi:MFS family permease